MPIVLVSTLPLTTIKLVRSPSPTSDAVAPGSLNVPPTSIVIGLSPSKVIIGVSGAIILTVLETELEMFPLTSVK